MAQGQQRRVDAEDGIAYTYEEFLAFYQDTYPQEEIDTYWEGCQQLTGRAARRARTRASTAPVGSAGEATGGKSQGKVKGGGRGKAGGAGGGAGADAGAAAAEGAGQPPQPRARSKAGAKAAGGRTAREPQPAGNYKVAICGGAGGIGQPLSLLVGMDPNVGELCIFDLDCAMTPPEGVAADLSHLERKCKVKGYSMPAGLDPVDHLQECLTGAHLVYIVAGVPKRPEMTQEDLFHTNLEIARGPVEACAKYCPDALLVLMVNPVNSVVPSMAELYKQRGLDPMKVLGMTTLDVVRANKFAGQASGRNPNFINVPVVGGDVGATILPLFSQDRVARAIDPEKIPELDKRVQEASREVFEAKGGKGSAALSMAYAGARFGKSVLAGLSGRRRIECAYCKSDVTDLPYFAQKVVLGEQGILRVLPLGELTEYESKRLEEFKPQLRADIEAGIKYMSQKLSETSGAVGGA